MQRTILGFDTSALNALHRGGPDVSPLLAGLDIGYAIRLNGTALDEIVAHSLPGERERLRKLCRKLLTNGAGDVLLPFHEITTRLAVAFESGRPFDWTRVDVRSNEYMRFIFDDEVSAALFEEDADYETISLEQRISATETAGQFEQVFLAPRPVFQKLRETEKESWPKSASELAQALQNGRRLLELRHRPIPQGDRDHGGRGENPTVRPRMPAVSSAPRGDRGRPVRTVDLGGSEAKARGPERHFHGGISSLLRRVHFKRPCAADRTQTDRSDCAAANIRSLVQGILRTVLSQLGRQEMNDPMIRRTCSRRISRDNFRQRKLARSASPPMIVLPSRL